MPEAVSDSQSSSSPLRLLRTKLFVPQAHPELVLRARLLDRLDRSLSTKLTLISAPAGFGKTTLLSAWIELRRLQVGWVSLDERDNDPTRFWSYVIAAVQTARAGVGISAVAMLQSPQPPPIEVLLTELVNEVAASRDRLVLVFDDYHEITESTVHKGVAFLLDNTPSQVSIILSGRSDPPLPLALLRARRQLLELRTVDLRFTPEEAEAFLNEVIGLALAADDIAALAALTEGWVAGLQLAALSIQEGDDVRAFVDSFSGGHRYVFDYLAQEILSRQPPETRSFLLETSVLSRLSGPLCDAVVDGGVGQAMLEQLELANLFVVPLDRERLWYRYHHLFRGFLRTQLGNEFSQAQTAALHRRAGVWLADHDDLPGAIEHALQANDPDWATSLVVSAVLDMFGRSELRTLLGWIEGLPSSLVRQNAYLSMAAAWALLATGRSDAVDARLQDVELLLGATADGSPRTMSLPPDVRGALAEISCLRGTLAFNHVDLVGAERYCHQVSAYLGEDVRGGAFNHRLALQGIAAFNLALAKAFAGATEAALVVFAEAISLLREDSNHHLLPMSISLTADLQVLQGQLHGAEATLNEALDEVALLGAPSPLSGVAYTGLGSLLYEWNDLERATVCLEQGLEMGKAWSHWEILLEGHIGLANIDLANGDPPKALARLRALDDFAILLEMQWAAPAVDAHRALLAVRTGDVEAASLWAGSVMLPDEGPIPYVLETYAVILARVMVAQGELPRAADLLARIIEGAQAGGRWGRVLEGLVVQAVMFDTWGDRRSDALGALCRALDLAEPEGYVRVFVDEGPRVRALLESIDVHPEYVTKLLGAFGPADPSSVEGEDTGAPCGEADGSRHKGDLTEQLTDRELEILALIAEGMTNRQIATQLFLSINTIKTHVKSVYGKLGVHNRAQAILRASDLGLI